MKVAFIQFVDDIVIGASGAGYVMGALIAANHSVSFYKLKINMGILNYYNTLRKIINNDIVFITCLSTDAIHVYKLSHDIKHYSNVKIVVGGPHPSIIKENILRECKSIDYICVGEGEEFAVELLKNLSNPEQVGNLIYRKCKSVISNPIRPPQDLSKLPPFPYHLYTRDDIVDKDYGYAYVKATRGCKYACSFCCNAIFLKMYPGTYLRYRPIIDVINEIKFLKQTNNPRFILFSDEMMLTNKLYAEQLFREIKSIGIPFAFLARVEHLTEDIIKLATDCGCKYISIGVECGNEEFRKKRLNRYMTNEEIIRGFSLCRKHGIYTTALTIIGFPFENDNKLTESTIKLIDIIKPNYLQTSIFYPFVGTPLYDYCIQNDLIDPVKQKRVTSCFEESILKGVDLKDKRNEILKQFNTEPFLEGIKW
jgi:radical SAM superfamily enzyme YgiQ (UPF0313 family)